MGHTSSLTLTPLNGPHFVSKRRKSFLAQSSAIRNSEEVREREYGVVIVENGAGEDGNRTAESVEGASGSGSESASGQS